jgi:hypothetical protein
VAGEFLEVLAVGDELVGGVDLAELAAAAAPDQQVHDDRGAGHGLAAARVVARQAEGAEQVVAAQQLLAQAAVEVLPERKPAGIRNTPTPPGTSRSSARRMK